MSASQFHYVIYIRATPEQLWAALREPALTRKYWANCWHECEWTEGGSWKLMIPDGRIGDQGEVVSVEPARRLVLSWQNEFVPELKAEGPARVSFEMEPVGQSTKLTVSHVMDRPDSQLIAAVSMGWPHILSSLKSLLETGESLVETRDWPEGV